MSVIVVCDSLLADKNLREPSHERLIENKVDQEYTKHLFKSIIILILFVVAYTYTFCQIYFVDLFQDELLKERQHYTS